MADKSKNFAFNAPSDFVRVRATLEETKMEKDDQADFTVQVTVSDPAPAGQAALFAVTRVTAVGIVPAGNTVAVLGGSTDLTNLVVGATKEAHYLVTAGLTPGPYEIKVTVTPQGAPTLFQDFTFPVPEQ